MPATGSSKLLTISTLCDHLAFAFFSDSICAKRFETIISFSFETDGLGKLESAATAFLESFGDGGTIN